MKTVTIYPTTIKVSEGMTLDNLTVVDGFEELLDSNISADRFKELTDAFREKGVDIQFITYPDGHTTEKLISKDAIKVFLHSNNGDENAFGKYFNMPSPEVQGIDTDDFKKILPLFYAAQRLGIAVQIKTCSDEDFRNMSEDEAKHFDDVSDTNSPVTLTFSTHR